MCRIYVEGHVDQAIDPDGNLIAAEQPVTPIPDSPKQPRKKNILIKETCREQEERIRKASPFGFLKSWMLFRFIVKSNDDVR